MLIGKHIIIECEGQHAHLSQEQLELLLSSAAEEAGAKVLSSHFHYFGSNHGVTGVVILAESHISVHTWPEYNYAAFDVFMCGACDPEVAKGIIIAAAHVDSVESSTIDRGMSRSHKDIPLSLSLLKRA